MSNHPFPDLDLLGLTPRIRAWIYVVLLLNAASITTMVASEVAVPRWYAVVSGVAQAFGHVLARKNVEK